MKLKTMLGRLFPISLLMLSTAAVAGPYGFDLHNVLSPRAAGIAGTTIAGDHTGPGGSGVW